MSQSALAARHTVVIATGLAVLIASAPCVDAQHRSATTVDAQHRSAMTAERPLRPTASANDTRTPPPSPERILAWINGYRAAPEPARVPDAVRALAAAGTLHDIEQAGIYVGFLAGVLGNDPAGSRKLIASLFPMAPEHQVLIIKAIAYSGLDDWKAVLAEVSERMPARRTLIDKYLYKGAPTLDALSLDNSAFAIDVNWGFYFATGAPEPIARIVKALAWSKDKNNLDRLTLASMAKWTLARNAQRDPELMRLCKSLLAGQDKDAALALSDAIDAAESFEIERLRKTALGAIEELRQKGPEANRQAQWWGQAGTTVLALGCVVAGALGQVEVGIPCVIGGALSTAATKYLLPGGSGN